MTPTALQRSESPADFLACRRWDAGSDRGATDATVDRSGDGRRDRNRVISYGRGERSSRGGEAACVASAVRSLAMARASPDGAV